MMLLIAGDRLTFVITEMSRSRNKLNAPRRKLKSDPPEEKQQKQQLKQQTNTLTHHSPHSPH